MNTLIGYHGTTAENAEKILKDQRFLDSNKNNEWLGKGVYFFAYRGHAEWWISQKKYREKNTAVLQAKLEYEDNQLLDLDDPEQLKRLDQFIKIYVDKLNKLKDRTLKIEWSKQTLEQRICASCNLLKQYEQNIGIIIYTYFWDRLDDNSKFRINQRQFCVNEHSIITTIIMEPTEGNDTTQDIDLNILEDGGILC